MVASLILAQLEMLDPAPTVRADIGIGFADGFCNFWPALQSQNAGERGERWVAFLEQSQQPPKTLSLIHI